MHLKLAGFLFSLCVFSVLSWSYRIPALSAAEIQLTASSVLLVTHPSSQWDGSETSKAGINATVSFARKRKIPFVYLYDGDPLNDSSYFVRDSRPDYWFVSREGEFDFKIESDHVYAVGGHFEICLQNTIESLIQQWNQQWNLQWNLQWNQQRSLQASRPRTVTYVTDAIYVEGLRLRDFRHTMAHPERFARLFEATESDDFRFAKVTLETVLNSLSAEDRRIYLARAMIPYFDLSAAYRIEVYLYGKKINSFTVGKTENPSVLKVEFVRSGDLSLQQD